MSVHKPKYFLLIVINGLWTTHHRMTDRKLKYLINFYNFTFIKNLTAKKMF